MPDLMLSDPQPSTNIPDLTGQVAYQTRVGVGAAASGAHGHVVPGTWTTAEGSKIKVRSYFHPLQVTPGLSAHC